MCITRMTKLCVISSIRSINIVLLHWYCYIYQSLRTEKYIVQGNLKVRPELLNSAAQQPRQTQHKGHIEHL
jgi:hypothetical protein